MGKVETALLPVGNGKCTCQILIYIPYVVGQGRKESLHHPWQPTRLNFGIAFVHCCTACAAYAAPTRLKSCWSTSMGWRSTRPVAWDQNSLQTMSRRVLCLMGNWVAAKDVSCHCHQCHDSDSCRDCAGHQIANAALYFSAESAWHMSAIRVTPAQDCTNQLL